MCEEKYVIEDKSQEPFTACKVCQKTIYWTEDYVVLTLFRHKLKSRERLTDPMPGLSEDVKWELLPQAYIDVGDYCFGCLKKTDFEYPEKADFVCAKCGKGFDHDDTLWALKSHLVFYDGQMNLREVRLEAVYCEACVTKKRLVASVNRAQKRLVKRRLHESLKEFVLTLAI